MNKLLLSLLSVIVFCIVSGCFSSSEKKALRAFADKNYDNAEKWLSEERLQIPAGRYALDKAYILRAKGRLQASSDQLNYAYDQMPKSSKADLLRKEILLNLALNSDLEGDFKSLAVTLQTLKEVLPANDAWLRFYEGLLDYSNNDYVNAYAQWKEVHQLRYLSSWMEISFQQMFPENWLEFFRMRAEILSGEYLQARKDLEEKGWTNVDQQNLLLGLTYIQEAREAGPERSTLLLKQAVEYFDKVADIQKKYPQEILLVNELVLNTINAKIPAHQFSDLPFLIETVQKLGNSAQLELLAKNVTGQLNALVSKEKWQELENISPALNELVADPKIRLQLSKRFEELTREALSKGLTNSAQKLATLSRLFSPQPMSVDERIAAEIVIQLTQLVKQPQFSREQAQAYLDFWKVLVTNGLDRYILAQKFLSISKLLWAQSAGGEDALEVMRMAMNLTPPNRQQELKGLMEKQLISVYRIIIAHNDFYKLKNILQAQRTFGLDATILQDPREIANLRADAELLYKQENYKQALTVADWIIDIKPSSNSALRLAGMSAYQLGDYSTALKYLRKLSLTSENIAARAAAEFAAGDPQTGRRLLAQAENGDNLSIEVYERLAISEILQGNASAALSWLAESPQINDEMQGVKFLALFALQRYKDALRAYVALPSSISHLEGILGAAALSAMYLDRPDIAEDYVKELYQNGNGKLGNLSYPFKELLNNRWITPSKSFVAAMYYKLVAKNDEKAVAQFKQIQEDPLASLEYVNLLISLGNLSEANKVMEKVKGSFVQVKNTDLWKQKFWLTYATLQQDRGAFLEALQGWNRYFDLLPTLEGHDTEIRSYVQTLLSLRLYAKAAQALKKIPANRLSSEDYLTFMEIQFHQKESNYLVNNAKMLLEKYPQDPYVRLKIAQWMFLTQNESLYHDALEGLPKEDDLEGKPAEAMLQLRALTGKYEQGLSDYQVRKDNWKDNPEVLKTLYSILEGLSDTETAKEVARRVGRTAPANETYQFFKIQYGDDDIYNQNLITQSAPLYDKNQLLPSAKLAYALALQEEALENYIQGNALSVWKFTSQLDKSTQVLNDLINSYPEIPELYYYLGQANYLLGKKEDALKFFQKSIVLDPSYAEAYQHLGLLYSEASDWKSAVSALENAVFFLPNNGTVWRKLGEAQEKLGNTKEAQNSYSKAALYKRGS